MRQISIYLSNLPFIVRVSLNLGKMQMLVNLGEMQMLVTLKTLSRDFSQVQLLLLAQHYSQIIENL
jgi:hypothetical protein